MNFTVVVVGLLTLVCVGICAIVNNAQCTLLQQLIPWLKETAKAALISNGEPTSARNLTTTEVPKLEVYLNESVNYGIINIIGLLLTCAFLGSGIFDKTVNIFLAALTCLFFVMNVVFLPKAFTRHNEIEEMANRYEAIVKAIKAAEVQPLKVDG